MHECPDVPPADASFPHLPEPRRRVLVAEDDELARFALVALLRHHDYEVLAAADGRETLTHLAADAEPLLLLLDWEMPHRNGLQICQTLREMERSQRTHVIMLTARTEPGDVLRAFEAGADEFLTKPVDVAHLLARLRSGLRILQLEHRQAVRAAEFERTRQEVRELQRLLPICMYCKRVRDQREHWDEIESYLAASAGVRFSHGICPRCFDTVLADAMPADPVRRALTRMPSPDVAAARADERENP